MNQEFFKLKEGLSQGMGFLGFVFSENDWVVEPIQNNSVF
jgi:hypothetical protein